jgi:hypothetical protein
MEIKGRENRKNKRKEKIKYLTKTFIFRKSVVTGYLTHAIQFRTRILLLHTRI